MKSAKRVRRNGKQEEKRRRARACKRGARKSVEWRSRRSGRNKKAHTQEQRIQGKIESRLKARSVEKR